MKSKRFLVSFTCLIAGVAIAAFLSGASCAQRAKDAATATRPPTCARFSANACINAESRGNL